MFGLWGLGGGILLLLFGVFCVFFFPSSLYRQDEQLGIGGVIIGVISLLVGMALIFW